MRYAFDSVLLALKDRICDLGFSERDAGTTAGVLLEAEVRGYPSQGLRRLDEITDFTHRGLIDPTARPRWDSPRTVSTTADAGRCLGHPVAVEAVWRACELASLHGLAMAGVVGASHIGYMTHYVELAARRGFLAIATTVSSPAVSLPGSGVPILGTNPLAYAFPYEGGLLCADLSLAAVSRGTVIAAREAGQQLPAASGHGSSGQATQDPAEILQGGIAPMGDTLRGLLVNLLFSILAGPLLGGEPNHRVVGTRWPNGAPNKGDFFLVFDISATTSSKIFGSSVRDLLEVMAAQGTDFHIPGETSRKALRHAQEHGVELPQEIVARLQMRSGLAA